MCGVYLVFIIKIFIIIVHLLASMHFHDNIHTPTYLDNIIYTREKGGMVVE